MPRVEAEDWSVERIELRTAPGRTEVIVRTQNVAYGLYAVPALCFSIAMTFADAHENGFGVRSIVGIAVILFFFYMLLWAFVGVDIITISDAELRVKRKLLPFLPSFRKRRFELADVRRMKCVNYVSDSLLPRLLPLGRVLLLGRDASYYALTFEYRGTAPTLCRGLHEDEAVTLLDSAFRALTR